MEGGGPLTPMVPAHLSIFQLQVEEQAPKPVR